MPQNPVTICVQYSTSSVFTLPHSLTHTLAGRNYHLDLMAREKRKMTRIKYWKPLIVKALAEIVAIAWYIKIKLLRTRKLPDYMA